MQFDGALKRIVHILKSAIFEVFIDIWQIFAQFTDLISNWGQPNKTFRRKYTNSIF